MTCCLWNVATSKAACPSQSLAHPWLCLNVPCLTHAPGSAHAIWAACAYLCLLQKSMRLPVFPSCWALSLAIRNSPVPASRTAVARPSPDAGTPPCAPALLAIPSSSLLPGTWYQWQAASLSSLALLLLARFALASSLANPGSATPPSPSMLLTNPHAVHLTIWSGATSVNPATTFLNTHAPSTCTSSKNSSASSSSVSLQTKCRRSQARLLASSSPYTRFHSSQSPRGHALACSPTWMHGISCSMSLSSRLL